MSQEIYKMRDGFSILHNEDTFDSRAKEVFLLIRDIKRGRDVSIKDPNIQRNATNTEIPKILKALEESLDLTNKTLINLKKYKR